MRSPIQHAVGQMFIPVRDMTRAVAWYADLLGIDPGDTSHDGTTFDSPTDGDTRLALDVNRPDFDPSGPPRFLLWTGDMAATMGHLRHLGVKVTSKVRIRRPRSRCVAGTTAWRVGHSAGTAAGLPA